MTTLAELLAVETTTIPPHARLLLVWGDCLQCLCLLMQLIKQHLGSILIVNRLHCMGAFLWDDPKKDQWPEIIEIMVHQRNWWILAQGGFTGTMIRIISDHWSFFRSSQRNAPYVTSSVHLTYSGSIRPRTKFASVTANGPPAKSNLQPIY